VGRLHTGAERRHVGARDRHSASRHLLDLAGLLVADQLTHQLGGGCALLAEDRLLGRPGLPEAIIIRRTLEELTVRTNAWSLVRQVKVQVDRYCHLTLPLAGRMNRLVKEHKAIADAIRGRDPVAAVAAVAALYVHLEGILSVLTEPSHKEDYFIGTMPDDARELR
jgi:hypothetical protein